MKKIKLTGILILFASACLHAQNNKFAVEFSYNKFGLSYHKKILDKFSISTSAEVNNQDIDSRFNDITFGFKANADFVSFKKSRLYSNISTGIYFPNNRFYKAITPFIGLNAGYEIFFKPNRHSLFSEIGYIYGKRQYKQSYDNEYIAVYGIDEFILSPVSFIIGYGFSF